MCYAYAIIFTVVIISKCSLGGMTIVNVLMTTLVVMRTTKMAILVCKHDIFLVKNRTAPEVPCSDQHKLPSKLFANFIFPSECSLAIGVQYYVLPLYRNTCSGGS